LTVSRLTLNIRKCAGPMQKLSIPWNLISKLASLTKKNLFLGIAEYIVE
jgi:hypothetical protein